MDVGSGGLFLGSPGQYLLVPPFSMFGPP